MKTSKQVTQVFKGSKPNMVGDGFRVQNLFPSGNRIGKAISPFFLLDYAAPVYFPPTAKPRGVDQHPHRGFETVTIVYQGALEHRDSTGSYGKLREGDVQWMTAASGIVHEEKHEAEFSRKGGTMEMAQLWVNLPKAHKMDNPGYQTLLKEDIPVKEWEDGSYLRVIAGEFEELRGPARTFTPINVFDISLKAGKNISLKLPEGYNTGIVVLKGQAEFNDTHSSKEVEIVSFGNDGEEINITAVTDVSLLVLNGEPINEPVFAYGPFLMNTQEEIVQAIQDYNEGRMGRLN